jgi:HEAT repeat protein
MRPRVLALFFVFASLALPRALAQDDDDETPPKPIVVEPGRGPQIPFDETRWEFWWFYNRDPLIRLRAKIQDKARANAGADVPFELAADKERQESIIPRLIGMIEDSNPEVRAAAVQALARTRDLGVRPALFHELRDDQFLVRLSAVIALGVWGNTQALSRLEDIVKDDTRELQERHYAAVALGLIGGAATTESLRQLLAPAEFAKLPRFVQAALAYGAGITRENDNADPIRQLLATKDTTDPEVLSNLVLALGKVGDPSDLPSLLKWLDAKDAQVRRSAAIGLGVLARKSTNADVVERLRKSMRDDPDLVVRNFAAISIGYVGGPEATKALRAELQDGAKTVRPFAALALGLAGDPESVELLLRLFGSEPDPSQRGALAVALGLLRDGRAAPDLRKALPKEGEPVVKGYVALALGMVGDVEAIPELRKVFEGANDVELIPNTATALGLLGDRESIDLLIKRAQKEKNEHVLQSLWFSLGLLGDKSAIAPLVESVKGSQMPAYVRGYAVVALGFIADPEPVRAIARISADSNYTIIANFLDELFLVL